MGSGTRAVPIPIQISEKANDITKNASIVIRVCQSVNLSDIMLFISC